LEVKAEERKRAAQQAELATAHERLAATKQRLADKRRELAAARRAQRECEIEPLKQLVLAPLPTDLVRLIFLLVPADARLRCREVSRGWCAFLADASLWRVCDLSARSGVVAERTPALLQAASARAQGTLQVLDVTGWRGLFDEVEEEGETFRRLTVLRPVLHANAASLVELRTCRCFDPLKEFFWSTADIEALLAAAPRLRLLQCDAGAADDDPISLLRLLEEVQFAPVRLQSLILSDISAPLVVMAARLVQHSSISSLMLQGAALEYENALDAVVNLAIFKLTHLTMSFCNLSPASLPALTRMLGSGSLKELYICNGSAPLLVGAEMPAFCAALRASWLVELGLVGVDLWGSLEDGLAVVAACTGHPTLHALDFKYNDLDRARGRAAIEAALDALETSNAELSVTRD